MAGATAGADRVRATKVIAVESVKADGGGPGTSAASTIAHPAPITPALGGRFAGFFARRLLLARSAALLVLTIEPADIGLSRRSEMLTQMVTDVFGNGPIRVIVVVGLIGLSLAIKAHWKNARDRSFGHESEPEADGDTVPLKKARRA